MNFFTYDLMLAACRKHHEPAKHTADPPPVRRNRSERRRAQHNVGRDLGRSKHSVVGRVERAFGRI
jgi:hypothetical protein